MNVSQIYIVDRKDMVEKIGTLSTERVSEILGGVHLLLDRHGIEE